MIKKVAAVIAFGAGTYVAYTHLPAFLSQYSSDPEYWAQMGGEGIRDFGNRALHIGLSAAAGAACAFLAYLLLNFYARAE